MDKGVRSEFKKVRIPILTLSVCVILGKLLTCSKPQFLLLYNGFLIGVLRTLNMKGHLGFCFWQIIRALYSLSPYHISMPNAWVRKA